MLPGAAPTAMAATGGLAQPGGVDSAVEVTGEYLAAYLKETDGDDSQFKDISSSVVPLSTGTSPPRLPPHESILKAEQKPAEGEDAAAPAKKPKLDVPFCLDR